MSLRELSQSSEIFQKRRNGNRDDRSRLCFDRFGNILDDFKPSSTYFSQIAQLPQSPMQFLIKETLDRPNKEGRHISSKPEAYASSVTRFLIYKARKYLLLVSILMHPQVL